MGSTQEGGRMHLREIIRGRSHHECGMRNAGGREGGREQEASANANATECIMEAAAAGAAARTRNERFAVWGFGRGAAGRRLSFGEEREWTQ